MTLGRDVALWGTRPKRRRQSVHPLSHPSSATFSDDGSRLAVKATSGDSVVLRADTLDVVAELGVAEFGEGSKALFGGDGHTIVEGSWNGDLLVRSSQTGAVLFHEHEQGSMIGEMAWTADRASIVYVVHYKQGMQREAELRVRPYPFRADPCVVATLGDALPHAVAVNDEMVAAVSIGPEVVLFELKTGTIQARRDVGPNGARGLAWWPKNHTLILVDSNAATGVGPELNDLWRIPVPYGCAVSCSSDGAVVAVGSWQRGLLGWL